MGLDVAVMLEVSMIQLLGFWVCFGMNEMKGLMELVGANPFPPCLLVRYATLGQAVTLLQPSFSAINMVGEEISVQPDFT